MRVFSKIKGKEVEGMKVSKLLRAATVMLAVIGLIVPSSFAGGPDKGGGKAPVEVELLGPAMSADPTSMKGRNTSRELIAKGDAVVTISEELQGLGDGLPKEISGEVEVYADKRNNLSHISLKFKLGGVENQLIVRNYRVLNIAEGDVLTTVEGIDGEATRIIYTRPKVEVYKIGNISETFTVSK